jgi:nitrogen fixation/metabolism regulation signal transduction histidine kinase
MTNVLKNATEAVEARAKAPRGLSRAHHAGHATADEQA